MSVCVCLCLGMSLYVCVYVYNVHVNTIAGHTQVTPAHVLRGSVRFQTEPHYSGQSLRLGELCCYCLEKAAILKHSCILYRKMSKRMYICVFFVLQSLSDSSVQYTHSSPVVFVKFMGLKNMSKVLQTYELKTQPKCTTGSKVLQTCAKYRVAVRWCGCCCGLI